MSNYEAVKLLEASGIFFYTDPDSDGMEPHMINLNDVFGWAWADAEKVEDAEMLPLAELYRDYGWCGVLYWVSKKRDNMRSEFLDNNRFIDFVAQEEKIKRDVPDSSKRAYHKVKYRLG